MSILTLSPIPPIRKKQQIECSSVTNTESPTLRENRKYRELTVFFAKRPFPGELPLKFAIFGKKPLKNRTQAQISVNFPRA